MKWFEIDRHQHSLRRAAIKLSVVQMPEQSDGHTCSDERFEVTDSKVTWR